MFSYSCPKFQCLYIFKNLCIDCFKLNFHQFGHTFPFNWPRQEAKTKQQQNKMTFTATRSQECLPMNHLQPTKLFLACCHWDFALINWLVCIAYCIFWHFIGSHQLFFLNWTVCLFVKESPT